MKYIFTLALLFATVTANYPAQAALIGNKMQSLEMVYDFAADGGAIGFIDLADTKKLPVGTKIMRVWYWQETAFTSGGAATVAIGDAASGARYLAATAYNNAAFTLNTLAEAVIGTPLYSSSENTGKLGITVAGAALTGGKLRLMVEYYTNKQ